MLSAAWDWYYGSNEEFLLAGCEFGKPYGPKIMGKNKSVSKTVIRPGSLSETEQINIFTTQIKKKQQPTTLEISAKNLKVLRHPNILRFIGFTAVESEVHLITERAYPLHIALKTIDAHEICSGLHDVMLALQFLHERASVAHNNVCMDSLYVNDNGTWKLGDFEFACSFDELTKENLLLVHKATGLVPPEEKDLTKLKFPQKSEHGHCRDVYCLGLLIEIFADKIRFSTHLTKERIQEYVDDLTRSDYESRPTMKEVLTFPLSKSPYINIVHFLQSITLKSKTQKDDFFRTLIEKLEDNNVFSDVIGRRIVPLILNPIVLAEPSATEHVIPTMLTPAIETQPGGLLPPSVFARYVIPKIVDLFKCRILHVRIAIMENFAKFVHLFEKTVLTDVVLPELLLGLSDTNNQLVQCSLHALADSVSVVGGDIIVGGDREKHFSLSIPKFDGRALNEANNLAYEITKFPQRKKPPPKKKEPDGPPLPATLLELAMRRPRKKSPQKKALVSEKVAMAKQQDFASSLSTSYDPPKPALVNGIHGNHHTAAVRSVPLVVKETKNKRPPTTLKQPEVETWASSDESDVESWPSFDEEVTQSKDIPPEPESSPRQLSTSSSCEERSYSSTKDKDYVIETPSSPQKAGKLKLADKTRKIKADRQDESQSRIPRKGPDANLGGEFEIVAKPPPPPVREEEPDFFADMAPKIATSVVDSRQQQQQPTRKPDPMVDSVDVRSVDSGQGSSVSAAFNIVEDNFNDDGWDNDGITWD